MNPTLEPKKAVDFPPAEYSASGNGNLPQRDIFEWFASRHLHHNVLPDEVITDLILRAQKGDINARDMVVKHNMKLVVSIANRVYARSNLSIKRNLDPMDLIQEGICGLLRAIEKFELEKKAGSAFSTYAGQWIKEYMLSLIFDQKETIRIPRNVQERRSKIRKIISELKQSLGREPTEDEIVDEANIQRVVRPRHILQLPPLYIVSTDDPLGNESETTVGDMIPDDSKNVSSEKLEIEISEIVFQMVNELNINQNKKEIFFMYFGTSHTSKTVGEHFNVSRQWVDQVCGMVIRKIYKKPKYATILKKLKKDFRE